MALHSLGEGHRAPGPHPEQHPPRARLGTDQDRRLRTRQGATANVRIRARDVHPRRHTRRRCRARWEPWRAVAQRSSCTRATAPRRTSGRSGASSTSMLALAPPFRGSNPLAMAQDIVALDQTRVRTTRSTKINHESYPQRRGRRRRLPKATSPGWYSAALVGMVDRLLTTDTKRRPSISEVAAACARSAWRDPWIGSAPRTIGYELGAAIADTSETRRKR